MRIIGYLVFACLCVGLPNSGAAQKFSCSFNKRGACLDYGDKVCSQFSKCVSQDAVCLQPHQCNYEGFTCKSNVTKIVDDHNDLAGGCRGVQSDLQELRQQYELQSSQIDILLSRVSDQENEILELESCVQSADTLEEAQYCTP